MGASDRLMVRERLSLAGMELPAPPEPGANYIPWRRVDSLLFLAGVTSEAGGGPATESDLDGARDAAMVCALKQLASIEAALGTLDAVEFIVRVTGYVACGPDFHLAPKVIDAASEVFIVAFGESGKHVRSAVGVSSLPVGATVELEVIAALDLEQRDGH